MKSIGMKAGLVAASLAGLLASSSAYADSDWGSLSAYVAAQSDYRFRGISQNSGEITPEGSINWTGPYGFYAGTWIAKTNWVGGFGNSSGTSTGPNAGGTPSFELDIYGGKHFDLTKLIPGITDGIDFNVEGYYYSYPDYNHLLGPANASFYETILQLTKSWGPLTVQATGSNSPQWSLGTGVGWYVGGNIAYAINSWLSVSADVGHQWVNALPQYAYWDLGATATWHAFSLDARYVDTSLSSGQCTAWMVNRNAGDPCKGGAVVTLTYNITKFPW